MKRNWESVVNAGRPADIGLMLEGTYPFVSGGVSSWVHQIINGFPQLTFSLVFFGGAREHYGDYKYPLPDNVVHLEKHYLMENTQIAKPRPRRGRADLFAHIAELHESLHRRRGQGLGALMQALVRELGSPEGLDLKAFLHSKPSWSQICDSYTRYCTEPSFINYFWTVRIMHQPLFRLAAIAAAIPPVKVLHSISTG
jgi:polysaccharide biosynthesis protein PelF